MSEKKLAIVTGSNQGIGLATVKMLMERNINVILTARDEAKGKQAAEQLEESDSLFVHQLDVTDATSVERLAEYVQTHFGKLDILINNAGIHYDTWQQTLNANLEEAQQTFDTNLFGAWRMINAFAPLLKNSAAGRVVNVSSGAGALDSQTGGTPAYSLSKLAMNGLTRQAAAQLKADGVLVNSVCPGWVRTQMGGSEASRSQEEGAETIVWAALLEDNAMTDKFFRDKQIIEW